MSLDGPFPKLKEKELRDARRHYPRTVGEADAWMVAEKCAAAGEEAWRVQDFGQSYGVDAAGR